MPQLYSLSRRSLGITEEGHRRITAGIWTVSMRATPAAGSARRQLRTVSAARAACAPRSPDSCKPFTRRWRQSFDSGLDLLGSMFAPCLPGCPGTPRQRTVPAARRGYR